MCLAVPGKVVSLEGSLGRVDFGGVERELCMDLLPGVGPGAWVLAHAGFAIQVLDEEEARATLALFQEWADFEAENVLGPTEITTVDGGHGG
ncbi:MAG: HypC/HybG/HupF family hydrogenase formation chaperone [Pseudomonadota bacterium]